MSTATSIEWTEITWNPTTGCDRISPGCDRCYALTLAGRLKAMGQPKYQRDGDPRTSGPGFGVTVHPKVLAEPLRWRKARKVSVDSMADVLHARVPTDFVAQVWAVMALTPQHVYQVLTKRPERYAKVLDGPCGCGGGHRPGIHFRSLVQDHTRRLRPGREVDLMGTWPLPNVWLGTSIENDDYVGRADALRAAPAAVRFLSLEPLLGPLPSLDLGGIDWVIVGGESGPGHRSLHLNWVRDLRDRCVRLGIPLFFKQVGGRTPKAGGRLLDGRTWDQFPSRRGESGPADHGGRLGDPQGLRRPGPGQRQAEPGWAAQPGRPDPLGAEPGLGRGPDGLPPRLDRHRWPAPPGPQQAWEPPRTVRPREILDRARRVSPLGDAVVPQQAALAIAVLWQRMEADR